MLKGKILFDTHGRPFYWGYGDYAAHIDQLAFRRGWRQALLRNLLKAQAFWPFSPKVKSSPLHAVAAVLPTLTSGTVRSALFHDTSWYKEARAIGMLRTAETTYFVRVHTQPEECLFEERQARFAAEMFSGSFIIAPILHSRSNCLMYKAVKQNRPIAPEDHIEERLLHLIKMFIDRHAMTKNLSESIPFGIFALCFSSGKEALGKKIREWIDRSNRGISHIPVHGDMTPWNMFVTDEEKIALIDYERAGWHVPFYDVFHYVLQPEALKRNDKALKDILYRKPWYHHQAMKHLLTLYLIDQFYLDLGDHKIRGFDHPSLRALIDVKAAWLDELLND